MRNTLKNSETKSVKPTKCRLTKKSRAQRRKDKNVNILKNRGFYIGENHEPLTRELTFGDSYTLGRGGNAHTFVVHESKELKHSITKKGKIRLTVEITSHIHGTSMEGKTFVRTYLLEPEHIPTEETHNGNVPMV